MHALIVQGFTWLAGQSQNQLYCPITGVPVVKLIVKLVFVQALSFFYYFHERKKRRGQGQEGERGREINKNKQTN